jgi:multimeric flavodoxin WrbA
MARLLFVSHSPSPNTRLLETAAVEAVSGLDSDAPVLRVRPPREADASDLDWCDGVMIGTTENFGYMAGLTKDFFERIYYPCLERTQGLPYALYVRAGEDGRGTRDGITRIATGLRWKAVAEPLILRGRYDTAFEGRVAELAQTVAAGLEAGIF